MKTQMVPVWLTNQSTHNLVLDSLWYEHTIHITLLPIDTFLDKNVSDFRKTKTVYTAEYVGVSNPNRIFIIEQRNIAA